MNEINELKNVREREIERERSGKMRRG